MHIQRELEETTETKNALLRSLDEKDFEINQIKRSYETTLQEWKQKVKTHSFPLNQTFQIQTLLEKNRGNEILAKVSLLIQQTFDNARAKILKEESKRHDLF